MHAATTPPQAENDELQVHGGAYPAAAANQRPGESFWKEVIRRRRDGQYC